MSLFLTLLCMSLGNFLAFNGIYKIEGLSIFFAASSIRGFSPISLVAALICTLPYSSQIIEDAESHFLTAQLCRISKKKYLAIVGSTVIISSFLVFFLPYLLLLGINLLVTPYQEIYIGDYSGALKELFDSMYDLEYREEIEIRYRTVTKTYTDEDGNEYTESHEEPYEYKKLIVTLHKKEMDSIIRKVFANYPDNLKHYEALFLAQGNMGEAFGNSDLISANGGIGGGKEDEASTEVQKKIVNAAYITPSPGAGWCAMWVSQVYQNAGLGYIGGNACDMYRNYTFTSDRSKLKVGMLVAVESSSSGSSAGLTYGHVGIYIGDGKVIDNIGHIRVTTLDDWIATFCKHHPVGFGFPPNVKK